MYDLASGVNVADEVDDGDDDHDHHDHDDHDDRQRIGRQVMYDLVSGVNVAETRCLLVGARPPRDFGSSS